MNIDSVDQGSTAEPASTSDAAAVSSEVAGYAHALENLRSKVLARMDLSVILQAMCIEVVQALTTADLAGITLVDEDGGQPETVASTDPRVNDVDADQYRSNEGPCLESARTQQVVRVRVSEVRDRWPRFADNVSGLGVESYLSAPLTVDDRHLGALNIYSYDPHGFSDIDQALVGLFVSSIETAVMVSRRARTAEEEVEGLLTAMKTRAQIEQAKGIIMAMRGIDAEQAFAFLSKQSQSRNIKVTDIAATLIASISSDSGEKR
ncbi:GAF and ANTAR domain-containing protein [Rhodococcus fascians]|nr:GAF and ANTAR domain-containing protein [Rhodococcus fascians]MBY3999142.1 GAF and ANTAR domain-containing protein [Rhodococcus fascians]MBY4000218.1 GAF and ANTAR domain-containing protein [Rhodococcus fascians]MBY4005246.1 GAF and ANTAR domain-containing protein [Rhodococcus fascians]MBY4016896.1 GAF and ANTAR domain-containing protein [Rhodococcus fascians]